MSWRALTSAFTWGVQRRARDEGLVFVAPYDDPLTVAGQGTIGTEILRQV